MSTTSQISSLATRIGQEAKALWAAVNAKAPTNNPTLTGTVTLPSTTSIGNVSSTELGYVDGVTSGIQSQLNAKANSSHSHAIADTPSGSLTAYAGPSAPSGWLLCYGQAVSRTTYADLFAVIGTTYGAGDGSTTFNLPDLRGRVVAGVDNMGGSDAGRLDWANTPGTAGGAQTHTLTEQESGLQNHSHGVSDPGHNHGISDPGHNHGLYQIIGGGGAFAPNYAMGNAVVAYAVTVAGTTGISINSKTTGISVNYSGAYNANQPHNNMQPTMLLNWIIKT